jgi:hypothetical protein
MCHKDHVCYNSAEERAEMKTSVIYAVDVAMRDTTTGLQNPLEVYDEADLHQSFRFIRHHILWVCDIIDIDIDYPLHRKGTLPPIVQLMVALRFYASGSFQLVVADTVLTGQLSPE